MLLKLSEVHPPKHRIRKDIGDLGELKASMKSNGLLEPIVVRKLEGHYEIIAGHRRFVAAHELGWGHIGASVVQATDKEAFEISLIENIHRKSMDPFEEAQAFARYSIDNGWGSITELASKIDKTEGFVRSRMDLLKLDEEISNSVRSGQLTLTHATELARLDNQQASELSEKVVDSALSSQQTRIAVDYVKQGLQPEQAVQRVLEFPDLAPPKPTDKFDPVKTAREGIYLTLEKALKQTDFHLSFIPDGEEKQEWVHQVRFPLHELTNAAIVVRKKHEPRDD